MIRIRTSTAGIREVSSMGIVRREIMPGIWLNYLNIGKFKTSYMSFNLLTQLRRETASLNALIPSVLYRGTVRYPDMEKLNARMEELYGASIVPVVRQLGEIQCLGFSANFPEESFLPPGTDEFSNVVSLLSDILLHPATKGGLFLPQYVESEKEKLSQLLLSVINNKRGYAAMRCREEMCCYEDYSAGRCGKAEDVEDIHYKKLTKQYRLLLETCPMEIFYCGSESEKRTVSVLKECLSAMPRGEIDYDIGTDIRLNALEAEPRFCREEMDISQARLVMGWRLGDSMDLEDRSRVTVFNAVFGGCVTSKLFMNLREKMGLCYDISSAPDMRKGLMFVNSGISAENFDIARDEILAQLEAIRNGDISDEELEAAKAVCVADTLAISDSQNALDSFYLVRAVEGTDFSPEESAELIKDVTISEVAEAAACAECDMIYLLAPSAEDEAEETGNMPPEIDPEV